MSNTQSFTVEGMSCSHCENAITKEVGKLEGVSGIHVSAQEGTLVIDSMGSASVADVISAVDEAGFDASAS